MSELKLYKASVEIEFYVLAEDERDAYFVADEEAESAMRDGYEGCTIITPVTDLARVPKDWQDSIPYGEDDTDRTIRQILTEEVEAVEVARDTLTLPLFK